MNEEGGLFCARLFRLYTLHGVLFLSHSFSLFLSSLFLSFSFSFSYVCRILCDFPGCTFSSRTLGPFAEHWRQAHPAPVLSFRCGFSGYHEAGTLGGGCSKRFATLGEVTAHRATHKTVESETKREQEELLRAAKVRQEARRAAEAAARAGAGGEGGGGGRSAPPSRPAFVEVSFAAPAFVGIPNTAGPDLPPDHWKFKSAYGRLGLPEHSPSTLVKKHFRKLALRMHPDKNRTDPLASQKYQQIAEAYALLTR